MAAITKTSRTTGKPWRATITMPGVKEFSRFFIAKKNAVAWAKKTESDLEKARIEGSSHARNLTLSTLISELTQARTLNHSTVTALTWWEDSDLEICCYNYYRRVKRREGKPPRSARAIRATIIHPSNASASTVLRWKRPPARPPTTGALIYADARIR